MRPRDLQILKSLHSTLRGRLSSAAGGVQEIERDRDEGHGEKERETHTDTAGQWGRGEAITSGQAESG